MLIHTTITRTERFHPFLECLQHQIHITFLSDDYFGNLRQHAIRSGNETPYHGTSRRTIGVICAKLLSQVSNCGRRIRLSWNGVGALVKEESASFKPVHKFLTLLVSSLSHIVTTTIINGFLTN